jgi:L-fucose isomerase
VVTKRRVGILTFSDGRESVHQEVKSINEEFQEKLVTVLAGSGEVEPVAGREIIWTAELAQNEAKRLADLGCEATIFNFAVWSFPHLAVVAAKFAPGPFLLFSNINPRYPGMVGMLASAGALDQIGVPHARLFGDIRDPEVLRKVLAFIRAASAINRLKGETFGLFGGRPMGMYTAVANLDQWMREFGIDVEHIDQWEIVRGAEKAPNDEVEHAFHWLTTKVGKVHYDGKQLTPDKLKLQIRSYIAVREMIKKYRLDFVGIKAQPELTDNFVTMDVTEAL